MKSKRQLQSHLTHRNRPMNSMSLWVDVSLETIMHDTHSSDGRKIYGLSHYLDKILDNQERLLSLLERSYEESIKEAIQGSYDEVL